MGFGWFASDGGYPQTMNLMHNCWTIPFECIWWILIDGTWNTNKPYFGTKLMDYGLVGWAVPIGLLVCIPKYLNHQGWFESRLTLNLRETISWTPLFELLYLTYFSVIANTGALSLDWCFVDSERLWYWPLLFSDLFKSIKFNGLSPFQVGKGESILWYWPFVFLHFIMSSLNWRKEIKKNQAKKSGLSIIMKENRWPRLGNELSFFHQKRRQPISYLNIS